MEEAKVARIVDQADGNAFYLEALIRAVAEGRDKTLPGTVVAMAHAGLERLEPDARRILRAASVIGETFTLSAVLVSWTVQRLAALRRVALDREHDAAPGARGSLRGESRRFATRFSHDAAYER
jgi:hypothetical protein